MAQLNLLLADVVNTLHYSSTEEAGIGLWHPARAPLPLQVHLQALTSTGPMQMDTRPQVATGVYTCVIMSKHVPHKPQRRRLLAWASLYGWGAKANCCSFPISPTTSAPLWEE